MKLKKTFLFNILLAVLVACLILLVSKKGGLKRLELLGLDYSFRLRGNLTFNPHIVIIEITDSDLAQIGSWPWKRSWHAAMCRTLNDLGAKYIFFDIIFSEPSNPEDDALLEEAIKISKNVYLPFVFPERSFDPKNALLPLERFSPFIKGMGSINIYADVDGTMRRLPLIFKDRDSLHMALKIALDYLDLKIQEVKPNYLLLANHQQSFKIPLIEKDTFLINWLGRWQDTFKHYRFLDVLTGYKDFLDSKKSELNLDDFKDSICIVAVTAIGLYDIKPTPIQAEYPGVGATITALSNILDKNFIYPLPSGINILLLYLLTLIPAFLITGEKPLRRTFLILLIGAIYFLINHLLFKKNILADLSLPLLGLFMSYLTIESYNFVRVSVERRNFFKMAVTDGLTGLYNIRYFKMLLETEIHLTKTTPHKMFSIAMSDVDHFKHFNDTYGHQVGDLVLKEVANSLKSSVRSLDIVARYGGEEMIVLLRGSLLKDGLNIAEKLRKNIENCLVKDQNNTYKVTVSLGVATFKSEDDVDTLIKRADEGLYKAKESGRNRVCSIEES